MRILLLLLVLLPGLAFGQPVSTPRDTVNLVTNGVSRNGDVNLALHFILAPGWHIYWSNPGDAGLAPQIAADPPAIAGQLTFPPPELLIQDSVASYILTGDVLLPFTVSHAGPSVTATASWLVCRDICIPEHGRFTLNVAQAPPGPPPLPAITASPFPARIAPEGTLTLSGPTAEQVAAARFFPANPGAIINRAPQPLSFSATGLTLRLSPAPGFEPGQTLSGVLELTDRAGTMQALLVSATPGPAPTPLYVWIAAAFLGGLILNLMPCVFPILAMKIFGLARLGGQARAAIRHEAVFYTAGVLAAMLMLAAILLALRAAGEAIGWGFQLQSPAFVACIAWLIFAAALNLAGVFEVAVPALRLPPGQGSFFTGLLAVVVATPCTAPFMGGALAAALAAPPQTGITIFLALGFGLAAPFLLLAFAPSLIAWLPRPGGWMVVLQRLLSIPMFLTFAWLAWLFLRESGARQFGFFAAGSLMIYLGLINRRARIAFLLPLLMLALFSDNASSAAPLSLPGATPFSASRLATLRAAGTPVFVDMTAAWCVTCLVNERTSLTTPSVQARFNAAHIKTLVGDWTKRDAGITAYLAANNRAGVPLYVFYPPAAPPVILPQILTPQIVLNAIR